MKLALQGISLGLGFFIVGTLIYLLFGMREAPATGTTAIEAHTIENPIFWLALAVCIVLGYALVPARARPPHHSAW
jgi:RsiW-degrading membrane proteinase PrsW (M82 family)